MKILFLPYSFPGPFRHTASLLASLPDTKVLFVTERSRRDVRIAGVRRILISVPQVPVMADRAEYVAIRGLRRGTYMANALVGLKSQGFSPDIIIAHAGQGCSLYVRDVFPKAFFVAYADGFHTQGSTFTLLSQSRAQPIMDFAPDRVRNFFQWNALHDCHMALTSTHWQKSFYPDYLASRIHVMHEGIDTDFFCPKPNERFLIENCDLSQVEELVTFSGRSLESRGFPHFLYALPHILQKRPKAHILIMHPQNKDDTTSQQWIQTLLRKEDFDTKRVHFLGFRPYKDYRMLLQASNVHVFLTAQNALSSGLFEAMSCGCTVLAGDTEPVREIITHGKNGFLYSYWENEQLATSVVSLLESAKTMQPIRAAARQHILENYDAGMQTKKAVDFLLHHYSEWNIAHAT